MSCVERRKNNDGRWRNKNYGERKIKINREIERSRERERVRDKDLNKENEFASFSLI